MVSDKPQKVKNFHFTWYGHIGFRARCYVNSYQNFWRIPMVETRFFRNSVAVCYLTRKDKAYQRKGYLWPLFNSIVFIFGMFQLFKTEICPRIRWQRISSWILFAHKSSLLRVSIDFFLSFLLIIEKILIIYLDCK